MGKKAISRVISMDSHRNGISGVPFNIMIFESAEGEKMLGIVFDVNNDRMPSCAVVNIDKLNEDDVAFGSNSYRGDYFYPEIMEHFRAAARNSVL